MQIKLLEWIIIKKYINVPIEIMISVIEKSIKNPYIGVDWVSIFHNNMILDQNGFNYNDVFGFNNDMINVII